MPDTAAIVEQLRAQADALERMARAPAVGDVDLAEATKMLAQIDANYVCITLTVDRQRNQAWRAAWGVWDGERTHAGAALSNCVQAALLGAKLRAEPAKELNAFEITRQIVPETIPF